MFSHGETMKVNFGCGAQYVGLGAELSSSFGGDHLDGDCVDIVVFFIEVVDNNLLEAVIFSSV